MMCKNLQHFHTSNQFHLRFELDRGTGPRTGPNRGPAGEPNIRREWERFDIEGGRQKLSSAGGDSTGGNIHEAEGAGGGGEEMEGAVVVREIVSVRVPYRYVLEEGEVGSAIEERE